VRIDGALHEFTTIPGVVEDVTDVILNLKEVRCACTSEGPRTLRLRQAGRGRSSPATPRRRGLGGRRAEPRASASTLNNEADVEIEVTVGTGKGYGRPSRTRPRDMPIGTIPIDSLFSPVRKVNYTVTNARVGRETDYDRLTSRSGPTARCRPTDAVAYAAKILKEQLSIFINFEEIDRGGRAEHRGGGAAQPEPVPLGGRARALGALGELPAERQHQLHRRAGAEDRGRDAQDQELRPQVAQRDQGGADLHGLSLGMTLDNFPSRKDLEKIRESREA
jgi:hypothetical protein